MTTAFDRIGVTRSTLARRVRKAWGNSSDSDREAGAQWYPIANGIAAELAHETGYSLETVAAVIAHLSPRVHWVKNVRGATALLHSGEAPGMLNACVNRAKVAMSSNDPLSTVNGPKTKAFAANILGDDFKVTLDSWMLKAVGLGEKDLTKAGVYDALSEVFVSVADKIGVSPATLQATIWTNVRGKAN